MMFKTKKQLEINNAASYFENQKLPEGVRANFLGMMSEECSLGRYILSVTPPELPLRNTAMHNQPVNMLEGFGEDHVVRVAQLTCKNYPELHQNVEQEIERRANQTVGHKIFLDMYAEKSISAYEACLSYYDVFGMKFQGASYYPMRIYDYPSNESFSLVLAFSFVLSRESVSIALEMSDVFDNILVDPERSFQMAQLTITRVRTTDGGYYCIDPAYQQEINEWLFGGMTIVNI